ncbi:leucine--tRNA ligase [Methanococcoides sp. SA1]|nr:leucine--tRNA ligase [Methanococcoides sp. SA1]
MDIDFGKIEAKWQGKWASDKVFEVGEDSEKEKFYVLEMFPYPSGAGLHMGHALNYTIGDILARFKMMKGFNVLHPMGFDALGLPAENAAIKAGTHPEDYTNAAIKNFIKQDNALGVTYDWSRMVNTASPDYYKWDQWIFLKMLEKGLAYQKESAVNWCSECDTVLANEQVEDGKCWRHEDTDVEVRKLRQWFFRTTEYAEELLAGLDKIDWPERTKKMQENWIGRSEGTEISFEIPGGSGVRGFGGSDKGVWKVFTTRPDTIFGVTFMVVSAGHSRLDELVTDEQRGAVDEYLKKMHSVSEKDIERNEKEGVFSGSYAVNPANGERVPIWIGNFVLADYGSGMVMGVPAHDKRDFDFAKKYGIEVREVVSGGDVSKEAYVGTGKLVNSGEFDGVENIEAKKKVGKFLKAKTVVNFKLRDWGVSRQRYWGTPIPVVYCDECGAVPVPEKDLPVVLPKDVKFGEGNPLEGAEDWVKTSCPKCGGEGRRETDTMDTFVNSSWYFLRYADPLNAKKIFDKKKVEYWNPVDVYIGGAEHACMHLLYARFYTKFLKSIGMIDFDEPFSKLFHQGLLHAEDGRKMSKSWGNVVEPIETFKKYGVDATRWFLISVASPDKDFDWSEKGISGATRFLKKVVGFYEGFEAKDDDEKLTRKMNLVLKNLEEYYGNFMYRKATIELRELFKLMEVGCSKETALNFLKMIAPICPHVAEELWEKLDGEGLISVAAWPKVGKVSGDKDEEDFSERIIAQVQKIIHDGVEKVFVYVMPFELEKLNLEKIGEKIGKVVEVFAVNDPKRYDPENRARKAKPGKAAVHFE